MDSKIAPIYMDWDDINSIIEDLKDVLDSMDDASPDFKEFKVGIARAIVSLRAERSSRDKDLPRLGLDSLMRSARIEYVKTIADAKLREELKAIFDF